MIPFHILATNVCNHLSDASDKVNLALVARGMYSELKEVLLPQTPKQKSLKQILDMISHVKQYPPMKLRYVFTHRWTFCQDQGFCLVIKRDTRNNIYGYFSEKRNGKYKDSSLNEHQIIDVCKHMILDNPSVQFAVSHDYKNQIIETISFKSFN